MGAEESITCLLNNESQGCSSPNNLLVSLLPSEARCVGALTLAIRASNEDTLEAGGRQRRGGDGAPPANRAASGQLNHLNVAY